MKVGVIGTGLVGGSLALKWAKKHQVYIYDLNSYDFKNENIIFKEPAEIAKIADVVFLATPIKEILRLADFFLASDVITCDIASVKAGIKNIDDDKFISTHPMAGSQLSGPENAQVDLFKDCSWAILNPKNIDYLLPVASLINDQQARIIFTDFKTHDKAVAFSSHLVQILEIVLSSLLKDKSTKLISGPALKEVTRLAESNYSLWQEIISFNQENIQKEINLLSESLNSIDLSNLEVVWQTAQDQRAELLDLRWNSYDFKEIKIKKDLFLETVYKNYQYRLFKEIKEDGEFITALIK
jgi:prephenate dehydrogenase